MTGKGSAPRKDPTGEQGKKYRANIIKDTSVLCKCGQRVYGVVACRHCGRKVE